MLSNHTWKRILRYGNCLSPPSPSCRERLIKIRYKKLGRLEHNRQSIAVGCIRIGGWLLVILESGWGAFTQKAHLARAYDGWRGKGNNRNGDKKAMYFPFSLKTRGMWKRRFGWKLYRKILILWNRVSQALKCLVKAKQESWSNNWTGLVCLVCHVCFTESKHFLWGIGKKRFEEVALVTFAFHLSSY